METIGKYSEVVVSRTLDGEEGEILEDGEIDDAEAVEFPSEEKAESETIIEEEVVVINEEEEVSEEEEEQQRKHRKRTHHRRRKRRHDDHKSEEKKSRHKKRKVNIFFNTFIPNFNWMCKYAMHCTTSTFLNRTVGNSVPPGRRVP